ncbi:MULTISPECIES: hypothetical protein [Comamonas]|uniref:hypothetical protein n=1 Tax=Comamonas TaxID=283 RepID=UPI001161CAA5|nr:MULTISPECIES: hypothetical protein [Comamonas]MBD9530510.1 hypothetical protein [Comamonas sp. CMM01]BBL24296.1 hypothetical protein CT3_17510 [Comamonas terrigena NBRC 13299]
MAGPAQAAGDSGFAAAVGQRAFVQAVADQAAVGWGSAVDVGQVAVDWHFADGVAATCLELLRVKQQVGVTCLSVSMERWQQLICSHNLTMRFSYVSGCSWFMHWYAYKGLSALLTG